MKAAPVPHATAGYSAEALQYRTSPSATAIALDLPSGHTATLAEKKYAPFCVSEVTAAGPAAPSSRPLLRSLTACWMGSVCLGTIIGYPVSAWKSLKGDPHFADIDPFWFASLGLVGAVGGAVVGAMASQATGRRWTMAVSALGAFCTWLCVGCAEEVWYLYTGRFINGFFAGMLSVVVPALIAELADNRNRGIQIGHRERAMEMQRSLRKEPVDANAEFKMMARAFSRATTPSLHYWLAAHIMFLQQFCGVNVAATYAREIVDGAGVDANTGDADLAMLVIQAAVTCAALPLMDTVGRLRLLLVSANICVVSMILLGGVYPEMPAGITSSTMSTAANVTEVAAGSSGVRGSRFALGFLAIFFFGYGLGIGPLTWIQAVELTPLRGHGVEFGSVCTFHWACAFCSATFFERVRVSFGFSEMAWFYGTLTFANGLVLYYFMPETKQLALETILLDECPIEDMLGRRRSFKVGAACRCKRPTVPTVHAGLGITLPPLGLQMKSDSMSNDVPSPFKSDHSAGLSQEHMPSTHIY